MKTQKSKINPLIEYLLIEPGFEIIDYNEYRKNKEKYDGDMPKIIMERADKVSLYVNPMIRNILSSLSGSSTKLLVWIMQSMTYGNDFVIFNTKRFLKETKMSSSTLIIAKKELIEKEIIALEESNKKHLWVNPSIMFKGNRVKKYPNNIAVPIRSNVTSNSKIN